MVLTVERSAVSEPIILQEDAVVVKRPTAAIRGCSDSFTAASQPLSVLTGPVGTTGDHLLAFGVNNFPVAVGDFPKATLFSNNSIALCLQKKTYLDTDDFVQKKPLRKQITQDLQRAHPDCRIMWVEQAGIFEAGTGLQGTVPLGQIFSVSAGFMLSGFVQYRTCSPIVVPPHADPMSLQPVLEKIVMPFKASQLVDLPEGAEFELGGLGSLTCNAGVYTGYLVGVGPFTQGVFAGVGAITGHIHDISLTITRLQGEKKARVQLRQAREESVGLTAQVQAGFFFGANPLQMPPMGSGILQYYLNKFGYPTIGAMATTFTALTAAVSMGFNTGSSQIYAFDYDLSSREAQLAYESAVRVSPDSSLRLANDKPQIIKVLQADQNSTTFQLSGNVSFCGQKFILATAIRGLKTGTLIRRDGTSMSYRDGRYSRVRESIFTGKKEIDWEFFSICQANGVPVVPTFRLHCKSKDTYLTREEILLFARLADSLHIDSVCQIDHGFPAVTQLEKIVRGGKPIVTDVDIFFTQEGIHALERANLYDACLAYLQAAGELDPKQAPFSLFFEDNSEDLIAAKELLSDLVDMATSSIVPAFTLRSAPSEMKQQYRFLTGGRSLSADAQLLMLANEFALTLGKISEFNNPSQLTDFFTSLGKSKGFDYMEVILAMAKLAGHDNTLVHSFNVTGEGVRIESKDGGVILTPDEVVNKEINAC